MIRNSQLNRRTLLRGAGGVAIGLPFLEAMAERAHAAETPRPKRLIIMYTSNGTVMKNWKPTSFGLDFTASPILAPLATPLLRPHLSVLSGVAMASAQKRSGNGHAVGMTSLLTGRPFTDVQATKFGDVGWGAGISIDQQIAQSLKVPGKLPSIELGVQTQREYRNFYSYISYAEGGGADHAVVSDDNPVNVFARLFSNVPSSEQVGAELERTIRQRKSVLDFVAGDFKAISGRLGAQDQARLDQHASLIRDLEGRLAVGSFCAKPPTPTIDQARIERNDDFPAIGKAQMDLIGAAFACDLTRVATLQWGTAQAGTVFEPWVKANWADSPEKYHHGISHAACPSSVNSPTAAQLSALDKLTRINTWFAEQLAYLATKLSAIDDGNGQTALDNTAILWVSEISEGPDHKYTNMPYVLLGGMGGALKKGEHFNLDGQTHNNLFVSLGQAMGVPNFTTFGDPEFCTGPIDAILA